MISTDSAIAKYAASGTDKLQAQYSLCGKMMVFILTNQHKENLPQYY